MHLPATLSILQYPESIQQNLHQCFQGEEKKCGYVGGQPILPQSADREKEE